MCILPFPAKPSSTRLISCPAFVAFLDEDAKTHPWRFLSYTNDLNLSPDSHGGAVMIVPFPNPTRTKHIGLVSAQDTKPLRKSLRNKFRAAESGNRGLEDVVLGTFGTEKLRVHAVGNYICSVALDREQLMQCIDWSAFSADPEDASMRQRLSVLSDETIMPKDVSFVVAKATSSVADDGFAVVYPDPSDMVFFPTCHENNETGLHAYDVCLYSFHHRDRALAESKDEVLGIPISAMPLGGASTSAVHVSIYTTDVAERDPVYELRWADTGSTTAVQLPITKPGTSVSFRRIKGMYSNGNISFPATSVAGSKRELLIEGTVLRTTPRVQLQPVHSDRHVLPGFEPTSPAIAQVFDNKYPIHDSNISHLQGNLTTMPGRPKSPPPPISATAADKIPVVPETNVMQVANHADVDPATALKFPMRPLTSDIWEEAQEALQQLAEVPRYRLKRIACRPVLERKTKWHQDSTGVSEPVSVEIETYSVKFTAADMPDGHIGRLQVGSSLSNGVAERWGTCSILDIHRDEDQYKVAFNRLCLTESVSTLLIRTVLPHLRPVSRFRLCR